MKTKTKTATATLIALAACSFSASEENGAWQQILPSTDFAAYDGRPEEVPGKQWKINNKSGQILAATLSSRAAAGQALLFDYEHQTLLTKENGQKAPASGHADQFEWREGEGLFAKLTYTPTAAQHVADKEYSFFSPVVIYDKKTGDVLDLHSVALTNDPAVRGMAKAALTFEAPTTDLPNPDPENMMNEALVLLFSLLGLDAPSDIDAAALKAKIESEDVKNAVAALKARLKAGDDSETAIAALKAEIKKGVDLTTHVPIATYNQVMTEMAALKADHESVTVTQVIEQAKKDGKFIAAAEMDYLTNLGNQDMAALKATLDSRQKVAAFSGKQTQEQGKPTDDGDVSVAALSADQKTIAKQLGISFEDYAKQLAKEVKA